MSDPDPVDRVRELLDGGGAVEGMLVWAELLHDKYLAYVAQGFTAEQAVYIVCWEFFGMKASG